MIILTINEIENLTFSHFSNKIIDSLINDEYNQ